MSNIKLDFKNFQYVSSDDNCTTLEHKKDKHQIILHHKALSKDNIKRLQELAPPKQQEVEEQEPIKMAEGGEIPPYLAADVPPQPIPNTNFDVNQPVLGSPSPEYQYQAKVEQLGKQYPHMTPDALNKFALAEMEREKASLEAGAQEREQYRQQQLQNIQAENQQRSRLGLAPLAEPTQPVLPNANGALENPPQTLAPPVEQPVQQNTQQPQTLAPSVNPGESILKAGILQQAAAEAQLGKEETEALKQTAIQEQNIKSAYEDKLKSLDADRQAFQKDIEAGYINPDKYWTGYTLPNGDKVPGHSKLMAAIGMIIAGFQPASNGPNAAAEMLKTQMNESLEAMKTNLNSSHNLLKANLDHFKNIQDATQMTKIMLNDSLTTKLKLAAAKAKTPMAAAQATQLIGKLEMEKQGQLQELAKNQTLAQIKSEIGQDPKNMDAMINALENLDPKSAKELRERSVPGVGLATTNEGAKGVREMKTTVDTIAQDVGRLREIISKSGKSFSPNLRAEADTIRQSLIGRLRMPITGPGAMSDGERELLMNLIPDVTSMTSLDSNSITKLNSLEQRMANNYNAMLQANGLKPQNTIQKTIERVTKDGRIVIYDAVTKQPLRYK
jgi:hypothetical protein